jgi:putative acetyltransferase
MKIIKVNSLEEINEVKRLFREYEAFLRVELNIDISFQQFEAELDQLPGKYAPPSGTLLLAKKGQKALACGALRRLGPIQDQTCEMKRLYVRPESRGQGLARKIAAKLIQEARVLGYTTMVLDTSDRLKAAMNLYESLGFKRTEPYYYNPLPDVVYWKLKL